MNGCNDTISHNQLDKLRQIFPEALSEDKADWVRLKATLCDVIDDTDSYGPHRKGKSSVFVKIQKKTAETLHMSPALQTEQRGARTEVA